MVAHIERQSCAVCKASKRGRRALQMSLFSAEPYVCPSCIGAVLAALLAWAWDHTCRRCGAAAAVVTHGPEHCGASFLCHGCAAPGVCTCGWPRGSDECLTPTWQPAQPVTGRDRAWVGFV